MSDRDDEVAALKARLAALEAGRSPSEPPGAPPSPERTGSILSLLGRGILLLIAVCCGLLIIGAAQSKVPDSEVTFNVVLAVVVAFVGVVCGWLAFRKPPTR